MRPRLLTDDMIRSAIRDATAAGRGNGVAVRALLRQRYGAKGSVARVYRLLAEQKPTAAPPQAVMPGPSDPESLHAAHARAALAEERERVHQERWARETDALRARLNEADRGAREAGELRLRVAELRRALAVAQSRIRELEQSLDAS
jgi:hypothetical protein